MPWLVSPAQAEKFRKTQKNVVILDATLTMPAEGRDPKAEYLAKHIIDAQFFSIEDFSDPTIPLPRMLIRDEQVIAEKLGAIGIRADSKIIIYDNSKLHTACRALWMFKVFGHNPQFLYVLDGGLAAWEKFGGKVSAEEPKVTPKVYKANYQAQLVRNLAQIKENLATQAEQIIDARSPVRFIGAPESNPALRTGHIPGSVCVPFTAMFEKNGLWKSIDKIREVFLGVHLDMHAPMVASCGSGTTAAVLDFALDLLGHKQHAIYDGSWSEWGATKLYPGETSLAERPVETSLVDEEQQPAA